MSSLSRWGQIVCTAFGAALFSANAWAAGPTLLVSSSANPAVQGSTVTLSVKVEELVDLFAFQYNLSFNPAVLQAASLSEGSFLSAAGETFYSAGTINNSTGLIGLTVNTLLGPVPGVSGNGVLSSVVFNVIGSGTSNIGFSAVEFLDSSLNSMTLQVQGGSIQAVPVPEPSAYLLFGAGLAGLAYARRRQAV